MSVRRSSEQQDVALGRRRDVRTDERDAVGDAEAGGPDSVRRVDSGWPPASRGVSGPQDRQGAARDSSRNVNGDAGLFVRCAASIAFAAEISPRPSFGPNAFAPLVRAASCLRSHGSTPRTSDSRSFLQTGAARTYASVTGSWRAYCLMK